MKSDQSEIDALKANDEPQKASDEKCVWDERSVTYMDVFRRVRDIMDKMGFAPCDDDVEDEENGEVNICIDFDEGEYMTWTNVRAFVGGVEEESIFEEIAYLDSRYELDRVNYEYHEEWGIMEYINKCRILGNVKIKDRSPAGIMKALDEAGL